MDPRTDAQLVEAFTRGSEEAFEVIVSRHGAALKSYALRLLCSPEEAEERCEEYAEIAYEECIADGGTEEECRGAYEAAYDECVEDC